MVTLMEQKGNSLLQDIQNIMGCYYLSDLHNAFFSERAQRSIEKIPDALYSLKEWNVAISYILNSSCACRCVEEAKAKLMRKEE